MNYDEIQRRKNELEQIAERKDSKERISKRKSDVELTAIKRTYITINSHADIFKYITIAIAIIGFVAGIVCGFVFSVGEIRDVGKYITRYEVEESFNVVLMIITWIGTATASFGSWTVYCILDSMDNLLRELKKTNEYHKKNTEKE